MFFIDPKGVVRKDWLFCLKKADRDEVLKAITRMG